MFNDIKRCLARDGCGIHTKYGSTGGLNRSGQVVRRSLGNRKEAEQVHSLHITWVCMHNVDTTIHQEDTHTHLIHAYILQACSNTLTHMHIPSYTHTITHTHIHSLIHTYIHSYTHTHIHSYTHTFTHTHILSLIHIYIHSYTYTHSLIHIHTFTHTHIH